MAEIIGLIPAAGQALRLGPLPCSKEIFPVGFDDADAAGAPRPKVAAHYLLEQMQCAGAAKALVILRSGKWDIPAYFGDGSRVGLDMAYLIMRHPYGVPYTLDQAHPFVRTATVLVGFPDIILFPKEVFPALLENLEASGSDICLALFTAQRPEKVDMVQFDSTGAIEAIRIKPASTDLSKTWLAAAWTPTFSDYMHAQVSRRLKAAETAKELYLGDVIQAAIEDKVQVSGIFFESGRYLDIGTPEDMRQSADFVCNAQASEGASGR
jgi:glucose-1-phosphate thymidylyltransferase